MKQPEIRMDDLENDDEEQNEKKLEIMMMASGGDYSPNSHTFFKHPYQSNVNLG
jgi:hypothetical protein